MKVDWLVGAMTESKYKDRARRYHAAIHDALLHEWDPIGVGDIPEAYDEYDAYVPTIYKYLITHKSKQELFDYLWFVETEEMRLVGDRRRTEAFADRLIEIRESLD